MCRFAIYLGPAIAMSSFVTEPDHSIIKQSAKANEVVVNVNGDGFGVAWYAPEMSPCPALFREITPAWSNNNLKELSRVISSTCILTHVRKASVGLGCNETNCHPFCYKELSFMHNGSVCAFHSLKRKIIEYMSDEAYGLIKGTTDSEHLFALFIDLYEKRMQKHKITLEAMSGAMLDLISLITDITKDKLQPTSARGDLHELNLLNMVITNGEDVVATKFISGEILEESHTLFYSRGMKLHVENGKSRILRCDNHPSDVECGWDDTHEGMIVISSEALTSHESDFIAVPPNHMVIANRTKNILEVKPITITKHAHAK